MLWLGIPRMSHLMGSALVGPISSLPRIFTHAEIHQIFHTVDRLPPSAMSLLRHIILPEIYRLLRLRISTERVLNLKVGDVDLQQGVITVRDGNPVKIVWCRHRHR